MDRLLAWNAAVLQEAEKEDGFGTLKGVRAAAMLHHAMDRAMAGETGTVAAAGAAAHAGRAVALHEFPQVRQRWEELLEEHLRDVPADEEAAARGAAIGASVLAAREGDGYDGEAEYRWHPMAPGVYAEFSEHSGTPEGFVFGAGWAKARPFALTSADELMVPPPPDIDSAAYTEAFREVKSVGAETSGTRTADQSHLAMWWKEFVESSHNRLARELLGASDLTPRQANLVLAQLNMAIHDAYLASFANKFHYNHWRPYTAIRWAANDGNPRTEPDPDWNNLHRHTYAFPSYPSAHGTACAAAMTVLRNGLGDGPFTMTVPEVDRGGMGSGKVAMEPPSRSFGSFGEAAEECSVSRVFLGIHFRYDSTAGTALGERVGERVLERDPGT